jgi:hypothetical protein
MILLMMIPPITHLDNALVDTIARKEPVMVKMKFVQRDMLAQQVFPTELCVWPVFIRMMNNRKNAKHVM